MKIISIPEKDCKRKKSKTYQHEDASGSQALPGSFHWCPIIETACRMTNPAAVVLQAFSSAQTPLRRLPLPRASLLPTKTAKHCEFKKTCRKAGSWKLCMFSCHFTASWFICNWILKKISACTHVHICEYVQICKHAYACIHAYLQSCNSYNTKWQLNQDIPCLLCDSKQTCQMWKRPLLSNIAFETPAVDKSIMYLYRTAIILWVLLLQNLRR